MKAPGITFLSILSCCAVLFSTPQGLKGQHLSIIKDVYVPDSLMSITQAGRKQKLLDLPTTKSLQLIQINALDTAQDQGNVLVVLPGSTDSLIFQVQYVRTDTTGDYNWFGELSTVETCPDSAEVSSLSDCRDGNLLLMRQDGNVFGEMQVDSVYYHIKDLGDGLTALVKLDPDAFEENFCAMPLDSLVIDDDVVSDRNSASACPVRLLVLYTEAALAAHPDIEQIAQVGVLTTRFSLSRSAIPEARLRIELAGIQALNDQEFKESNDIRYDRLSLPGNAPIANLRSHYKADLVVILTDAVYANAGGSVTAFGDAEVHADSAFAIVEAPSVGLPYLGFAHEVGHLFGARHEGTDLCAGGDNTGLAHAHGMQFNKKFEALFIFYERKYRTVVTGCLLGSVRVIHNYSNPHIRYSNKPTGRVNKNDNARTLRDAACRIASYVVSNEVQVFVKGPGTACTGSSVILQALMANEPSGPFTYYWETSYDGFTWFGGSTGGFYTVSMPATPGRRIFVRLTVTGPGGLHVWVAWHEITASTSVDGVPCMIEPESLPPIQVDSELRLLVHPNPTNGQISLTLENMITGRLNLVVHDSYGRDIYQSNHLDSEEGILRLHLDLSRLPAGMYWIRCRVKDREAIASFIRIP